MDWLKRMYDLTAFTQTEPIPGDSYHITWVLAVLIFCVVACLIVRYSGDRTYRVMTFVLWVVMLVFEVYKQTVGNIDLADGELVFSYTWEKFPFQLCSTPLYVLPFLALLKDGKARDFFASYTMTYALIGGIAVYMFPESVFGGSVIGNVQTMVHHGIQIVTGVMTAARYRDRLNRSFFLKGFTVFIFMFTVAMTLNTAFRDYMISLGMMRADETFNMFLISPYMEFSAPAFENILLMFTPWVLVVLYFVGLPIGALIVMKGCKKLFGRR